MFKATVITTHQNSWDAKPKVSETVIEAASKDDIWVRYFKEFDNRTRYANSTQVQLKDQKDAKDYQAWHSDPANYAPAGGDMW